MLEKTLEIPLDSKEIKPVSPKGNQSWIFIGRTDAEAEAPILWCKELIHCERPWCWGRLRAGGEGGDRGWGGWITDSMDMSLSKFPEIVKDREVWHAAVHAVTESRARLSDWRKTKSNGETLFLSPVFPTSSSFPYSSSDSFSQYSFPTLSSSGPLHKCHWFI